MKKILKFVFILMILSVLIIFFSKYLIQKNSQANDDILFLKLFGSSHKALKPNKDVKNKYELDISYKNLECLGINLIETIDNNTLVHEKIAPGTNGNFSIVIKSNKKSRYKVYFESLNSKPFNLTFNAYENGTKIAEDANTLEKLSENLSGSMENDGIRVININWHWNYDGTQLQDIQDTEDSKKISKYMFNIYAEAEKID